MFFFWGGVGCFPKITFEGALKLAPRTDGYVVDNPWLVGKSPKDRIVGPLPNHLNGL